MLIVRLLIDGFRLYYIKEIISSDTFKIGNVIYSKDLNSKENEGFIGFYDWLRSDEFTIVGVRICYFEHQSYNELLKTLPYLRPTFGGKCLELLFREEAYIPELSGDQDFTNNYVFKSKQGDCLLTFGLDHMTDKELSSLMSYSEVITVESL
jgi:hypothetical protein